VSYCHHFTSVVVVACQHLTETIGSNNISLKIILL
jgi:hypothetical protein